MPRSIRVVPGEPSTLVAHQTYLTPEEAKLVDHAQQGMDEADELVSMLLEMRRYHEDTISSRRSSNTKYRMCI